MRGGMTVATVYPGTYTIDDEEVETSEIRKKGDQ